MKHKASLIGIMLIVIPVLLRVVTPFFFKSLALSLSEFSILLIAQESLFWLCLGLFVLQALFWQLALKRFPLSFLYPFTSLSLVFLLIIGNRVFGEAISLGNIVGMSLIITGIVWLSLSTAFVPSEKN